VKNLSIVDGHAHMNELADPERDVAEARTAGVGAVIAVGMDRKSNEVTLALADRFPRYVYPALGYHPWEIREGEVEETLSFLKKHVDRAIAVGEVGLDYKVRVKKSLQRDVLERIIELAAARDKALILHCRYSHERVFRMISRGGIKKAVFHWYTGPLSLLGNILASGYYISVTPAVPHSPKLAAAVRVAPLDRILLESDCPVAYDGKESRPRDTGIVLHEVARIKGLSLEEAARVTTGNIRDLYGISPDDVGR